MRNFVATAWLAALALATPALADETAQRYATLGQIDAQALQEAEMSAVRGSSSQLFVFGKLLVEGDLTPMAVALLGSSLTSEFGQQCCQVTENGGMYTIFVGVQIID